MFGDTGFAKIIWLHDLTWTNMHVQVGLQNTSRLTRWLRTSLEMI